MKYQLLQYRLQLHLIGFVNRTPITLSINKVRDGWIMVQLFIFTIKCKVKILCSIASHADLITSYFRSRRKYQYKAASASVQ